MIHGLTPRQAVFVKNLSKGHTQKDSAILAGYSSNSADVTASRMLRNAKIVKALDSVGLTDKRIAQGIKKNAIAGEGVKANADTSIRSFELAARLKGYLTDKQEPTNLSQTNIYINELKQMSDSDLQSRLDQLVQDIQVLRI